LDNDARSQNFTPGKKCWRRLEAQATLAHRIAREENSFPVLTKTRERWRQKRGEGGRRDTTVGEGEETGGGGGKGGGRQGVREMSLGGGKGLTRKER